jgi:hypothetical protein
VVAATPAPASTVRRLTPRFMDYSPSPARPGGLFFYVTPAIAGSRGAG